MSGAPKVRAMQIIDELEVNKRGPYGGGVGHVGFSGTMDIALALRTMVIPTAPNDSMYKYDKGEGARRRAPWGRGKSKGRLGTHHCLGYGAAGCHGSGPCAICRGSVRDSKHLKKPQC